MYVHMQVIVLLLYTDITKYFNPFTAEFSDVLHNATEKHLIKSPTRYTS